MLKYRTGRSAQILKLLTCLAALQQTLQTSFTKTVGIYLFRLLNLEFR